MGIDTRNTSVIYLLGKMTFSKSVSKRPNLCRNDSSIFGQNYVSVSKWHCVEIVCVEVTGTPAGCIYMSVLTGVGGEPTLGQH